MINGEKVINISDTLHGSILLSTLESKIISTTAFNRLHNILQNSTVYLTFPSNQTKRFEHSLGVMTLGGKMFYHSVANASEETLDSFFEVINTEIQKLIQNRTFIDPLESKFGDTDGEFLVALEGNWKNLSIDEAFYNFHTPNVIKDKYKFAYLVTYQSVRIAALLHDIGHPPFSHITEFALKDIWKRVVKKQDDTGYESLNTKEKDFLEATQFYKEDRNAKLHEQIEIGLQID